MPITMKTDQEHQLSLTRHIGTIDDESFLSAYRDFYSQPEYQKATKRLVDLRDTDSSSRSYEALKAVNKMSRQLPTTPGVKRKIAILAGNQLSFGLARVFGTYNEMSREETSVFYDLNEAVEWLQIPHGVLERLLDDSK